ncbi:MAG: DNA polymerase III subunit delta [Bacilli bacterium]|nr:DNA polymerase III subunit delta [Bacilli bacterium]
MENNYLIETNNSLSLKKTINSIVPDDFKNIDINYYDLEEVELKNPLDDLDTYGLFNDKKIIVINNIDKLSSSDIGYNHLLDYLDNYNPNNILILTTKKINNTKKVFKDLKKRVKYLKVDINALNYIKENLEGYKLEAGVIDKINEYCDNDINKIYNECQKIKYYKIDSKEVSVDDVEDLLIKKNTNINELTFEFIRYLFKKDKVNALSCYKKLENNDIEPISLIGLLASQIRIIYQVKVLVNKGLKNSEIANILDEKEYRIKKTRELINYYSEEELLKLIRKLSSMDLDIKTTDVDSKFLIELFIINLKK